MGDFLIGTLFLREMSSPLVSAAKVMRRVSSTLPSYVYYSYVQSCMFVCNSFSSLDWD